MPAAAKNVRVSADAHADLKAMADEDGLTLREEMDRLIQHTKRARFFEKLSAQHRGMSDEERASYREEMRALEGPMRDGLPEDEFSGADGQ